MDLGIENKVALVTGGSRGLGRHAALSLAREGVHVAICGRTEDTLRATVRELQSLGGKATGIVADITDPKAIKPLLEKSIAELGSIEILVNNVGGSRGRHPIETTEEQYREAFDLNLFGALRLIQATVPQMQQRRWGRVINIASIYGREFGGGASYMVAKAALIALSKNLAITLARDGVLVNSVAPGSIAFPGGGWERFQQQQPVEVVQEFIKHNLPMGKFGSPEPIGDIVAFLASERASLITGACINVDGGQSHSLI